VQQRPPHARHVATPPLDVVDPLLEAFEDANSWQWLWPELLCGGPKKNMAGNMENTKFDS